MGGVVCCVGGGLSRGVTEEVWGETFVRLGVIKKHFLELTCVSM